MEKICKGEEKIFIPKIWQAVLIFCTLILVMFGGIVVFGRDPHVPMFIGVCVAVIVSLRIGFKWADLEKMMIDGIAKAMEALLILIVVGMLIGVWILSGTIPSMIYYGLMFMRPEFFLIATVIVCALTSLATGTSWGTMGTIGLAIMGIGAALGIPVGPTAGAIISGAYFGDKLSPLSETTNLAAVIAGTDVFTNVKYVIRPTIIALALSLLFFGIYGGIYSVKNNEIQIVDELMRDIESIFTINPVLLVPPVIVVLGIVFKIPALPGITIGAVVGAILAVFFQTGLNIYDTDGNLLNVGVDFGNILFSAKDGFYCVSDNKLLSELLTNGGIMNMASSILMTLIAMAFGGIMEGTGMLDVIVNTLLKHVKSDTALVCATELTCIGSNIFMPEQYISILVPGRMYSGEYKKRGIHPKSLASALESGGTVTSALVPWNTCAIYINSTLGVSPIGPDGYLLWAIFNLCMPLINFILAFFKITVTRMKPEEQKLVDSEKVV